MQNLRVYQRYLRDEFERRRQRNSTYSLRAFARDLEIPSPKLSQYLAGSCGISGKKAALIAQKLGLGPAETDLFICSAEAAHSRDSLTRKAAQERLNSLLASTFSEINMDKFNLIRDWYHLAILELTEISSFESNAAWIAKALNISEAQASEAVERLVKLGLLRREDNEKWTQTQRDFETPPDFSSRAIREYHQQMIRLAASRVESVPLAKRELGSVLFGLDQELIPEMKKLIRNFQKETAALAERSKTKGALYALNLQLMPIFEGSSSA